MLYTIVPTQVDKNAILSTIVPTQVDKNAILSTIVPTQVDKNAILSTIVPTQVDKNAILSTIVPTQVDKNAPIISYFNSLRGTFLSRAVDNLYLYYYTSHQSKLTQTQEIIIIMKYVKKFCVCVNFD